MTHSARHFKAWADSIQSALSDHISDCIFTTRIRNRVSFSFHYLFPPLFPWLWCNSSSSGCAFPAQTAGCMFAPGCRLMGRWAGGGGQQGTMMFSTFDKAAETNPSERNNLENLVKLVLSQSMLYESLLRNKAKEVIEANIHPSQNGPRILLWPYRNKTVG